MMSRIAIPIPTSFDPEYNRHNYAAYAESVRASGGEPVQVALHLGETELAQIASSCDGLLLPGSPADVDPALYGHEPEAATAPPDPAREFTDATLLASAIAQRRPVLGICFGTQMINVLHGGTLVQDLTVLPVNHKAGRSVAVAHTASVAINSSLAQAVDEYEAATEGKFTRLPVNSSHHQAIGIVGQGLQVCARCPQDGVVEAIEATSAAIFLIGVQWHPERTVSTSATSRALFHRLIAEAAKHPAAPFRDAKVHAV